jgi:ribosome-associated protein
MTRAPRKEPDIAARVRVVVAAALDRKAQDVRVLHLGAVTEFTEYFVICSGTNSRQVQAIAEAVQEGLRAHHDGDQAGTDDGAEGGRRGVRPLAIEGLAHGQWALLDYGDFLVHVFDEERRAFYGLDKLWSDAPDVTSQLGG